MWLRNRDVCFDSLRGAALGELFLAEPHVLFDSISETAASAGDVADDSAGVESEAFESVVFHLASNYLSYIAVDRLHETVVVARVCYRHQHLSSVKDRLH